MASDDLSTEDLKILREAQERLAAKREQQPAPRALDAVEFEKAGDSWVRRLEEKTARRAGGTWKPDKKPSGGSTNLGVAFDRARARLEPIDLETFRDELPERHKADPVPVAVQTSFERPSLHPLAPIIRPNGDPQVFVGIAKRDVNGDHQELAMFPADELENSLFRDLEEHLEDDSFVTLHGFAVPSRRDARGEGRMARRSRHVLSLPAGTRRMVRTLSAIAVDLDVRDVPGLDVYGAQAEVMRQADQGKLPQPSVYWYSGRGLWVLWLLGDRLEGGEIDPAQPPPAFPGLIEKWKKIGRAAHTRLTALGSDLTPAINQKGFVRVPGSKNTKSGRRVQALFAVGEDGKGFVYTLDELADAFGLPPFTRAAPVEAARMKDPRSVNKGYRGQIGRANRAFHQFDALREMREGFREPCRHSALDLYARILNALHHGVTKRREAGDLEDNDPLEKWADMTSDDFRSELTKLAGEFDPPWPASEIRAQVNWNLKNRSKGPRRNLGSNQDIGDALHITPDEHAELRDRFRRRKGDEVWPVASVFEGRSIRPPSKRRELSRAEKQVLRRNMIRSLVSAAQARGDEFPSSRELQEALREQGINGALRTILNDLEAMGLESPNTRAAREKRKGKALPFENGI